MQFTTHTLTVTFTSIISFISLGFFDLVQRVFILPCPAATPTLLNTLSAVIVTDKALVTLKKYKNVLLFVCFFHN
jgi:hypothetical protein